VTPAILILGAVGVWALTSKRQPSLSEMLTRKIEPLPVNGFQDTSRPEFTTWVSGNPEFNNPVGVPLPVGPNVPSQTEAGNISTAKRFLDSTQGITLTRFEVNSLHGLPFPWKNRFDHIIYGLCQKPGFRIIDPVLVKAIMFQESGFNENAYRAEEQINDASAGLMQLLRKTARWIARIPGTVTDAQVDAMLYDPVQNTALGMRYIGFQIGRYGRTPAVNLDKAIAAYNAGSAKYNAAGHFVNASYVASVRSHMGRFANHFPPLDWEPQTPFTGKQ